MCYLYQTYIQVYPYSYMSSFLRFKETELPPIEAFANDLTGEPCSQEDYDHVCRVWDVFGMKTLKDLCELYVKTDTILLDCVFQSYRKTCLSCYKLDPIHFFTSACKTFIKSFYHENNRNLS